jgi:hypothetical protein
MNYICLITFRPTKIWCKFLNTFTRYKIIIIVDDTSFDLSNFSYDNITFVQIDDDICKRNGYINTNFLIKQISGWDKALYYFGKKKFNYVWFLEDDVFFNNDQTLNDIDAKYCDLDLLTANYDINKLGKKNKSWHWPLIDIKFNPPYYNAMCCGVRMSKNMLLKIKEYANKHKTLFFLEALFPTLCKKHNLKYDTPDELKDIVFRKDYYDNDINKTHLFHPVKDIIKHVHYRTIL